MTENYLAVSWSVSRGRDTYGYNICRLDDTVTRKRYKCMGGGYDMVGTVFADWLKATHGHQLAEIARQGRAHHVSRSHHDGTVTSETNDAGLYGLSVSYYPDNVMRAVMVDGACGIESVQRIAEAIGIKAQRTLSRRGQITGFIVSAS